MMNMQEFDFITMKKLKLNLLKKNNILINLSQSVILC